MGRMEYQSVKNSSSPAGVLPKRCALRREKSDPAGKGRPARIASLKSRLESQGDALQRPRPLRLPEFPVRDRQIAGAALRKDLDV
jgi:hypothetical protein